MLQDDVGKKVVVIPVNDKTRLGKITWVSEDGKNFRIVDDYFNEYQFNEDNVSIKFKGAE